MAETKYIRVALGDDEAHNFVLYSGMIYKQEPNKLQKKNYNNNNKDF